MRLMGIGVAAVARCLAIPDPIQPADRSWGAVLKNVRNGIDGTSKTVAARSSGDGEVFDSLYATLDAVKNPWRNSTMHPANKSSVEEAEHIFAAVRRFLMNLADRCDQVVFGPGAARRASRVACVMPPQIARCAALGIFCRISSTS
jgi:hypothetical protein